MPDREKVAKGLCETIGIMHDHVPKRYWGYGEQACRDAITLLKEQEVGISKAETTTIVRCKDCKWWDKKSESLYGYCHACKHGYLSPHWEIGIYRTYKGDWFCADGEWQEGR